ncbi:T9SS type B sorting domain-containing protein [Flavobacterium sp. LaA7.5]|nr:T9SS type B sorting domain-containing protein [Flavobacterium salilacus subsp. altitudinum]
MQDFTLNVVATDESCDDNAMLTFNVGNVTTGSDFLFTVFLQPDLENPVAVTDSFSVSNLDSGTYTVIATQSLNGESNSQQVSVVINNVIEPLAYDINSINQNCSVGGQIEIITTNGTAAEYEIISGPETRPIQTSNVFSGLQSGTYNIRVFDICGQGVVTTYTLVLQAANPTVTMPAYEEEINTDCDSVIITNTITYPEGVVISYPLTVTYTIHPPNGDPDIIEIYTYNEGAPNLFELIHEFELYDNPYTYDISIVNGCGIEYGNSGMTVNPEPVLAYSLEELECGDNYLILNASQYSPPYSLEFFTAPEGFNPVLFNSQHLEPFEDATVQYGNEENTIPEGEYLIELTDACGRTATVDFEVVIETPEPIVSGRNNGCFSDLGRITATVPDRDIVAVEVLEAPAAYIETLTTPLPHDVSSFINSNGRLSLTNLPLGDYVIRITDVCGEVYEVPVTVPVFVERDFTISTAFDCTIGIGSVEMSSGNGSLTAVTLLSAPASYEGDVPADLSDSIASGDLYIDDLPEGNYTFLGTDVCGIERELTITVLGYQPSDNPFTFIPNCGSFDIMMTDDAAFSGVPTYWLQKLVNADTGEWGHPDTNVVYTEGTVPTEDNSLSLENNTTIFNLTFSGDFRVIKAFESFGNGSEVKNCLEELGTFNYLDQPRINAFYKLSCIDSPDDVYIDADGIPPLNYRIEDALTNEIIIDNGANNIFSNLASGSYRFVVEDDCGNISRITQNIDILPDLVAANEPEDLFYCIDPDNEAGISHEFNLSELNDTILGNQSEDLYILTYHISQADADAGTNPLDDLYIATQPVTTIYARLIHSYISICYDVVSFQLLLNENPVLQLQESYYICDDSTVTLFAGSGYDSYLWSTGQTSPSITVDEAGIYTVTVMDGLCDASGDIVVELSAPAATVGIETEDWTYDNNAIIVSATGNGNYEYSLDGIIYQNENIFTGLEAGLYTVYIQDINGCGVVEEEVVLLNYPKFFTPNGDGINETWRIPFSSFEPELYVFVYDRYGKLITGFDAQSNGWDGTYNGNRLPSTDYWFVVTRQDGRVHKGHFSMVR